MYKEECSYEEAKLMELLANNSECAFQMLYDRHRNRIYRLAMRHLKSQALAQDVVQDVFMKLWSQRNVIKIGGPIEGWLFTVGKNNIINRLKKLSNEWKFLDHLKVTHNLEDNTMQDKFKNDDYQSMLNSALDCLSEKQRQVYTLARQDNLSYLQIAEHMEISPLTVKTHMSRALGHIRSVITVQHIFS